MSNPAFLEQVLNVIHAADVRQLQQLTDFFTTCIFFRGFFLAISKSSNVVLLFYTTLEVYTNLGMVSVWH